MAQLDPDSIRHALEVARSIGVTEVELEFGDTSFSATLAPLPTQAVAASSSESEVETDDVKAIVSPLVGYFQDKSSGLVVGATVSKGGVVGIVSALGLANDVEAPFDGVIIEVLVGDNDPVHYGQPLARVRVER